MFRKPFPKTETSVHWLLDVDDTLMTYGESKLSFNESLLKTLVSKGVTTCTLLTKMDSYSTSYHTPIRKPLISELKNRGIEVARVITPLDVLYKTAAISPADFKAGDAYSKHMEPVENALQKLKQAEVKEDEFAKFAGYFQLTTGLHALQWLIKQGLIKENTKGNEIKIKEFQGKFDILIKQQFSDASSAALCSFDFDDCYQLIRRISTCDTIESLMKEYKNQIDAEEKTLSSKHEIMKQFFQIRLAYRNRQYYIQLNNPAKELTKGQVYDMWLGEMEFKGNETTIFVDDNDREHKSLNEAHKKRQAKHKLYTLLPPKSDTQPEFRLCTNENIFEGLLKKIDVENAMKSCFGLNFDDRKAFLKKISNTASKLLNEENINYEAACRHFEILFLLADHLNLNEEEKKSVIVSIQILRNDMPKTRQFIFDNIKLDSALQQIVKAGGLDMRLKRVELNNELFKISCPYLLGGKNLFNEKKAIAVSDRFSTNVLNAISSLAFEYINDSTSWEKCLNFMENLRDIYTAPIYKEAIENRIENLKSEYSKHNNGDAVRKKLFSKS